MENLVFGLMLSVGLYLLARDARRPVTGQTTRIMRVETVEDLR